MNKLIVNTLRTRGFVKEEYLHQARAKTREAKANAKEANVRCEHLGNEMKVLKKLYQNVVNENIELRKPKEPIIKEPKRINHRAWADKVKKRDKCCDICASQSKLEAHHLWSRTAHPTLATELDNGVTLCEECHSQYHRKRVQQNCTPATYYQFKEKRQKHVKIHKIPSFGAKLLNHIGNLWNLVQGVSKESILLRKA